MYLTLAQTYLQVEAVYLTKPGEVGEIPESIYYYPEAENVVITRQIERLQEYLFENPNIVFSLKNEIRLKLKYLKEDGSADYVLNSFENVGFTNPKNPNFINITLDAAAKATLTRNADNSQNITFDSAITENERCIIYLDNIAGMPTATYTFQVMVGFTFSNEGYPGDKNGDEVVDYMSFTIRKDDDKDVEYSTGKLKIGTINDGLSKGVFVWDGSKWVFLPKAGSDVDKFAEISCGNGYKYFVYFENDPNNNKNYDIYIDYHRKNTGNTLLDKTDIKLNIHGTSGYILEDFVIVLFNTEFDLSENRQSVYGGKEFNILTDEDYGITAPDGASFELDFEATMCGESNTDLNKKLSAFKLNDETNSLVQFNKDTNILTTKTVGQNVDIDLVFKVKIGDYYLRNITYKMQILRSLQFFFNGDEPVVTDGKWQPDGVLNYSTNFVLTNKNAGSVSTFYTPGMEFSFGSALSNGEIGFFRIK